MSIAESIRNTVRREINKYGSNASLYSFSAATTTTNEEGEITISAWGSATTIKVISSDHMTFKRILEKIGLESDESGRGFLIRDDVTISPKDKIVIDSVSYEVISIKKIDPIQNIIAAYKIIVSKNEVYL